MGCGRSPLRPQRDVADANRAAVDARATPDRGPDAPDASFRAQYAGLVLATRAHDATGTSHAVRALFTDKQRPVIGGCPECCCGSTQRGTPVPKKPPDAGRITLAADTTTLATLDPAVFKGASGTHYGMSEELGWPWFSLLGDYAPVKCGPWDAGDILQVMAAGNEVEAFSASLPTGPPLTGVVPSLGSSPLLVDRSKSFTISWRPQDQGEAIVLLRMSFVGGLCICDAPDAAGRLVMEANLLNPTSNDKSGTIKLSRLTVSTVASSNAIIDLVGAEVIGGPITIE